MILDIYNIPYDDKKTWKLIQSGLTCGCFQLESNFGQDWAAKIQPENINELSAVIALLRPACLESGQTEKYYHIKKGELEKITFDDNDVDKILAPTLGILCFQEQLMKFGDEIAWRHLPRLERLIKVDKLRKCLSGDSFLLTNKGPIKLKDIYTSKYKNIKVLTISDKKLVYKSLIKVWKTNKQPTLIIKTRNGYSIEGSYDHRILTQGGWKELKDITTNDCVLMPKKYPYKGITKCIKDEIAKAIIWAYFIGEGCYTEKSPQPKISNSNPWILEKIKLNLIQCFGPLSYREDKADINNVIAIYFKNQAKKYFEKQYKKIRSKNKFIPNEIIKGSKRITKAFIGSYFSAEGEVNKNNLGISSTSKEIIQCLQMLLLRHEVKASITEHNTKYKNQPYSSYRLYICDREYISRFYHHFSAYICPEKIRRIQSLLSYQYRPGYKSEIIPKEIIKAIIDTNTLNQIIPQEVSGSLYKKHLTYDRAAFINNFIGSNLLSNELSAEYIYVPVQCVTEGSMKELYDFTVNESHSAFINGILTHNSIGKKDSKLIQTLKSDFIQGCIKNGKTPELSNNLFELIEKAGRYAFNACVAGNEQLMRGCHPNQYNASVEEMFQIRNNLQFAKKTGHLDLYKKWKFLGNYGTGFSLHNDHRIKTNVIEDIYYAGKKTVFKITLENTSSINVTANHKFPTPRGTLDTKSLNIGDELYICGPYTKDERCYNFSNMTKQDIRERKVSKRTRNAPGFDGGERNPGYTNVAFSEWEKNKALLPNECQECGKNGEGIRLEIHHIDGDRTNNQLSNLKKLCPSCHKKEEYQKGRKRKGQKGYPCLTSKIVKIENIGKQNVYDITMRAPYHNFVTASKIVTCNSHSIKYAHYSYKTAYLKANYPLEFYIVYLSYSRFKMKDKEEIRNLINEARLLNIIILPPQVAAQNNEFQIIDRDRKIIRFGLSHIKDVGSNDSKILKNEYLDNWTKLFIAHFRSENKLRALAVNALICSGACDTYGTPRIILLEIFNLIKRLSEKERKFIIQTLPTLESIYEFTNLLDECANDVSVKRRKAIVRSEANQLDFNQIDTFAGNARLEKEFLGLPLTCSAIDDKDIIIKTSCQKCNQIIDNEGIEINIHAVLESYQKMVTKKGRSPGQEMAILEISDKTGALRIACFPREFSKYKDRLHENEVYNIIMQGMGRGWCIKRLVQI